MNFPEIPLDQFDDYLHRPLVASNELCQAKVLDTLKKTKIVGNTAIGVGTFFILNAVAVTPTIERIFVFDRSPRVTHFWEKAIEIIKRSKTRFDVILAIEALLKKESTRYFEEWGMKDSIDATAKGECEAFQANIAEGISWLSHDEKFNRIKEIFHRNCFVFARVDLFNVISMCRFKRLLEENNLTLGLAYLSNISQFCSEYESYTTGMNRILLPTTYVISAHSLLYDLPTQIIRQRKNLPLELLCFPEWEGEENRQETNLLSDPILWIGKHFTSIVMTSLIASAILVRSWRR